MSEEFIKLIEEYLEFKIEGLKDSAMHIANLDDHGNAGERRAQNELCGDYLREADRVGKCLKEFREFVKGVSNEN